MKSKNLFMQLLVTIGIIGIFSLFGSVSAENNNEIKFFIKTTSQVLHADINETVKLHNPEMKIDIRNEKSPQILWAGTVKGKKANGKIKFQTEKLNPELWTPASPVLYRLQLTLTDSGREIKKANYRIGFRSFETKNGQIYLNGHPIFLRGIAINPPGRGIPKKVEESREFALDYVRFMKSINVNIIRIPDNETWYNVCDELGMMVFGGNYSGSVNGEKPPADYDEGVNWYETVKFQPIMHHPALMIYALTNEVPYRGEIAKKWIDFLSYAHNKLQKWDNTRLYIANAGYGYGQSGDICDLHRYWGWYYSTPNTFLNIRDYDKITSPDKVQPLTFTECVGNYTGPDGRYNLTPNHKNPVSQLNWTGHAPQRMQAQLADEHQSWTFKTVTELIRRLRKINPESTGVFPFTIMFRNWHTVKNFVDMDPKPVAKQARVSYQPVLLSWENWQPQVYAGSTIHPIAHIINDSEDFSALKNNALVFRILDKAYTILFSDTLKLPDIDYYQIHSEKLKINIPKNLFEGDYKLEGIVYSSGKEVSRNSDQLFIAGLKEKTRSTDEIPVYDPSGKTISSLKELGFSVKNVPVNAISKKSKILVIGENAAVQALADQSKNIHELVNNGGRVVILKQNKEHQPALKSLLPVPLDFPEMNVDNPEYPPPPRPSRNSFNINPERLNHPVFCGISREELKVWSDYTNWDESQPGFPAIYPVTNGFTLQNKHDKAKVAILANYSVGLEGIALAELFDGKGSVLMTGFDLVNRTNLDPVADRLLVNLLEYSLSQKHHDVYPLIQAPILWGEYETEKGVLDGITSGLMLNSKPALFGSYENLPLTVERDGHLYAGGRGGWNNRAGKQYVPYGRRIFGPYYHRDFGGIPTPVDPESETGKAYFWCRVPENTNTMKTLVWNPSKEMLEIIIEINDTSTSKEKVLPGEYRWVETKVEDHKTSLKINLEGDRRLVVLESKFN